MGKTHRVGVDGRLHDQTLEQILREWRKKRMKYLPTTERGGQDLEKVLEIDHQLRLINAVREILKLIAIDDGPRISKEVIRLVIEDAIRWVD